MKKNITLLFLLMCTLLTGCYLTGGTAEGEANEQLDLYEYVVEEGHVKILHFNGDDGATSITVPSEIEGKPVTVIGEDAFRQYTELEEVILPETLERIENDAFGRCFSLKSITIPKSVQFIDGGAFWRCRSLEGIWVEDGNRNYFSRYGVVFASTYDSFAFTNEETEIELYIYPEGKPDLIYLVGMRVTKVNLNHMYNPLTRFFVIPPTVTELTGGRPVFSAEIVFIVTEGSAAEAFAKENGVQYMYFYQPPSYDPDE
jgi:hypothetical protein